MKPLDNVLKPIDPHITIYVSKDIVEIELHDEDASITFAKISLDPNEFCAALGRLACCKCEIELYGVDKIGKRMEHKDFIVEMPKEDWKRDKDIAARLTTEQCPKGWRPDLYFGSQGSFFEKDGKRYAKSTIRRWV